MKPIDIVNKLGLKVSEVQLNTTGNDTQEFIKKIPTNVDWRKHNKISSHVQKQGKCKSNWAMTAASTLESAIAILYDKPVEAISVQHLIDCDF